jgi:hypothetical protein
MVTPPASGCAALAAECSLQSAARPSLKELLLSDAARTDLVPPRFCSWRVGGARISAVYLLDTNVRLNCAAPGRTAVLAWF